ncbi:AGCS family alanine or glycine:cation symporter [Haloferula luteola]|uniref:AGCS family alanine or glycine:cation symporter n=1 Tax=Haloferula luteola TaxID=595692 RepID=A0A840VA18_9BACT|nr:alanine/glycine:cation symporter family protein [Haloferula luteola]MBB5353926.1 AGCS family alanine or glycine:cation symporter [Haloferula luteola]
MQVASLRGKMSARLFSRPFRWFAVWAAFFLSLAPAFAQEAEKSMDQKIDEAFGKATGPFVSWIFKTIPIQGYDVLWVVLWLAAAGVVMTLAFNFINIRAFPLAVRTVRGRYSRSDDPGEVTHFQALTAAVSGTVGLGNIAGVAIGISIAGPGVAFWLFLSGFLGMATKFAECTLGVKYREIDSEGRIHGGGMQYLRKGFAELGMKPVGQILAVMFAIFCVFASFGGGNVFQINQATAQLINVTGGAEGSFFAERQWVFGLIVAVLTALVIIGGIQSIAKVTSKLVPLMCLVYVVSALIVLGVNASHIPAAIGEIVSEAFKPRAAVTGGILAAFVWGMRRATFSNEAGIGSAPIAHSAAKTRMPASEGVVALLEPFIDTVIVCTMTSLVLVTTMYFDGDAGTFSVNGQSYELGAATNSATSFGIGITSAAFETVHDAFRYVLFACVTLFAFSTLITWSYYGLQAWQFLFGTKKVADLIYKLIFCAIIIAGASASMGSAVDFSDASLFAMSIPNLIGVYFLLPVVRRELSKFTRFTRLIDQGKSLDEAEREVEAGGR